MTPTYDREFLARVCDDYANQLAGNPGSYSVAAVQEQARLLREADNAEAAKVRTVNSRSRLRRIAAERGEPAPRFDAASEDGLLELIGEYWCLAYAEGKEGRTHDTEDGAAQRKLSEIKAMIRRLAIGQEGK